MVCFRHFEADVIAKVRRARLGKGAYPTLRLEGTSAAKSARKLEGDRAVPEDTLPALTDPYACSGDCGMMPPPSLLMGG